MRYPLPVFLFVCLLLVSLGCSTSEKQAPVANAPQPEPPTLAQPTLDNDAQEEMIVVPQEKSQPSSAVKSFTVKASKFTFEPSIINVKKGDTVTLTLESTDVTHGFSLSAFNVDVTLEKGKTETVTFVADKEGTFPFVCSVYCGSGHSEMRGTLVVEL